MRRDKWDFLNEIESYLPPRNATETRSEYVDNIHEYLLHTYPGEETNTVRTSARCCAHVFGEILLDGKNIVSQEDIHASIEFGTSDLPGEEYVSNIDVESWFGQANLIKIEREYLRGSPWFRFKYIHVAPILPTVDKFVDALRNPPVLTNSTIEDALLQSLLEAESHTGSDADDKPRVDSDELAAFIGSVKSLLDAGAWFRVENVTPDSEIWVNPEEFDRILQEEGEKFTEKRVKAMLDEVLTENIPENLEDKIDVSSFKLNILSVLHDNYGWEIMSRKDDAIWYASDYLFIEELGIWTDFYKEIADMGKEASQQAIDAAKVFFKNNSKNLIQEFNADPDELTGLVKRLEADLEVRRLYTQSKSAIIDPSKDNVKSEVKFKPASFTEVAKEIEQKLEHNQDEEEEEFKAHDSYSDYQF